MIGKIQAAHLLLDDGWASPGYVVLDAGGAIADAAPGVLAGADLELSGYVVPGIANLHSHAHHRGLVGYADRLAPGNVATLWTWRETMYRHLLGLDPDDLEAYATLAYIEMLSRGYTAVGEFHYLHHDPEGRRYRNPAEMSERIIAAARSAGIALTLLPALYGRGGVGKPPEPEQRRFTIARDEYLSLLARLEGHAAKDPLLRVGAAPHSLRAVHPAELEALLTVRTTGPIHIHAAERTEEVDEVVAGLGARPIEWLLANAGLDARWCVIHATHMTESERRGLAQSGAVAGLCPLTEANLADGLFPLASYRHDGGRLGIGTDANHVIDLPGELRMLEYGQRVTEHRRDALLAEGESSVGEVLFGLATAGGAQALAQPMGAIRPGLRCDLVELDPGHPALIGQIPATILDAWIFSTASDAVVRTVIVGGEIVIRDGHHPLERVARTRVEAVMGRRHSVTAPPGMTVRVDGRSLTVADVIAVARDAAPVELAPAAIEAMRRSRRVLEETVARGERIYGVSTAAGALQRVPVAGSDAHRFNRMMILNCRVGQGAAASREIVRGTLLRLANLLARGVTGVRPELAEVVVLALNRDWPLNMRMLGSVGQADLAPMSDLAHGLIDTAGFALEAGEGMALIDNNCFSTAIAALAVADLERLADALDVVGALEMEAFLANPSILDPVLTERPYPGLQATAARLRKLLAGSWLWQPEVPRNLQDPLTYRCLPEIHGALRDALDFAHRQLVVELNAAQSNPLVNIADERVVSVGCFDVLPLAAALDYLRIALAPVLTSANERMMKLLHTGFSGLPPGLSTETGRGHDGFTEFGVAGQGLVAEARLLASPVSFEMASTTQAEGIEDRTTMAPLAGRRLSEMVGLGEFLAAMELVVAAQAIDLRPGAKLGAGTNRAYRQVRTSIPAVIGDDAVPGAIDAVIELVRTGAIGDVA